MRQSKRLPANKTAPSSSKKMKTQADQQDLSTSKTRSGFQFGSSFGTSPTPTTSANTSFQFGNGFGMNSPMKAAKVESIENVGLDSGMISISGRVAFIPLLRNLENGTGKSFDVVLLDQTGKIQFSSFDEKLFNSFEMNQCVEVSNVVAASVNPKWKLVDNDIKLNGTSKTLVEEIDASDFPELEFNLLKFADIKQLADGSRFDTVGIITDCGQLKPAGAHWQKECTLVDGAGDMITLTLWNDLARDFQITEYTPVILGNSNITSWQGSQSVTTRYNTVVWTNPENAEAEKLFTWFKRMQGDQE